MTGNNIITRPSLPSSSPSSSSSSSSVRGILALWSGCLGALGAAFAKLAFATTTTTHDSSSRAVEHFFHQTCSWLIPAAASDDWIVLASSSSSSSSLSLSLSSLIISSSSWTVCDVVALALVRGVLLWAMIACNALMLASFVQGMNASGSVAGTALSTAANFACSAALGYLLWNEHYSRTWWSGFGMVVLGTYLLSTVGIVVVVENDNNANKKPKASTLPNDSGQNQE
jgi:hypothetical protein